MTDINTSVYRQGADTGLYFGLYLTVLFFTMAYSINVPVLSVVSFVLMLGVPVFIYACLRSYYCRLRGHVIFSGLWMYGIMIFLCGSLISAAVSVIYMKWISPGFMATQMQTSLDILEASTMPEAQETAKTIKLMRDSGMLPGPAETALRIVSFNVFTGSMLSALMALLARARGYKNDKNI
ncbi:MAG: DUF4199 domain-containing protein [Pseudoflavonifractor sp.]|nr:DUF4199 domain-containing protein [Pseudoflavonifractor sp.]